jgi:hypothetical protein
MGLGALGGTAIVLTTEMGSFPRTVADPSAGRPGGERRVSLQLFHHVGPVSGRISGPKSAVFPGPQKVTEGMFRVGKTKVQMAAKKLEAQLGDRRFCYPLNPARYLL